MGNWPLLILVPIGLVQIHRRKSLARGFYAVQRAGLRGADALDVLRRAAS